MKRLIVLTMILAVLAGGMVFANGQQEGGSGEAEGDDQIVVGVSFSDYSTDRWPREAALLTQLGQERGVQVITQVANQDARLQNDQIQNMVLQGADVLIVVAQDGAAAVTAVDAAAREGIPVIAYDRLIPSPNLAAYLSFDNVEVGRAQARGVLAEEDSGNFVLLGGAPTDNNARLFRQGQMEVLQPHIDEGDIEVVANQWVENWDPNNALSLMENILTAQSNNVDAVVASNDGTALGAIQALQAQGLAGEIPISGQDATLAGVKAIVEGTLTVTVFKDVRNLSPAAMDMAISLAQGEEVGDLTEFSLAELTLDENMEGSVPCRFLPVVQVTDENVYEEVILTGFQPYDEVYADVPEDERPPRP